MIASIGTWITEVEEEGVNSSRFISEGARVQLQKISVHMKSRCDCSIYSPRALWTLSGPGYRSSMYLTMVDINIWPTGARVLSNDETRKYRSFISQTEKGPHFMNHKKWVSSFGQEVFVVFPVLRHEDNPPLSGSLKAHLLSPAVY